MNISKICNDINNNSSTYRIGSLQEIRARLRGLTRIPTYSIFNSQTIHDDWAFHVGGRSELQFNIGNENEGLRYGFAFSLEPSRNFPSPEQLYPKILRLNSIISSSPQLFQSYDMWIWEQGVRTSIFKVREIHEDEIAIGNFIFIGKIQSSYDLTEILTTFDNLLDIYISVENTDYLPITKIIPSTAFVFNNSNYQLTLSKTITTAARSINVDIRHSLIQIELANQLKKKYGSNNVVVEHGYMGNRIDVVVKDNSLVYFYEVKVGDSAKSCIRQALGQLFEYAYYPSNYNASKLIVVGEPNLDSDSSEYLSFLNKNFNIPIEYLQIVV